MTTGTTTLTTYRGIIEEDGVVRLRHPTLLPVGTEVLVVVAQPLPSLEEQKRRLATLSPEEWREPFNAVHAAWDASEPAPDEGEEPFSNDELVELIHKTQQKSV